MNAQISPYFVQTHERFIGFLIESRDCGTGNFPLWLAPEQVRVESDLVPDPIKAKIGEAERARVHTMLVIGGRDVDAGNVSVRLHSKGPRGAKPKGEVVAEILASIKERRS
jgi:threonyl-tRNA synthetase